MNERLWHVSDREDISVFFPRPVPPGAVGISSAAVWAIGESRLANYLLPRECPRVCFWHSPSTTEEDARQFLGQARHAVVLEGAWYQQLASASVWLYEMPHEHFTCIDESARYFTSSTPVTPRIQVHIADLRSEIVNHGAELRSTNRLRELAAEVASSTLAFSIIRLRNAQSIADAA